MLRGNELAVRESWFWTMQLENTRPLRESALLNQTLDAIGHRDRVGTSGYQVRLLQSEAFPLLIVSETYIPLRRLLYAHTP